MRILLVGEYSNLHNSLKAGLQKLGHEVILISAGDAFKKFPTDIDVRGKRMQDSKFLNLIRQGIFRVTRRDLALLETAFRTKKALKKQKPFDVVQLINEYPFKTSYRQEKKIIKLLRDLADRMVVLACGDDHIFLSNIDKLPHHPIAMHKGKIRFRYSEKYLTAKHKKFHEFVFKKKDLVISSDLDYHTVYEGKPDYYGLIPNPVNLEKIEVPPFPDLSKIKIFHGINRSNYHKKGNDFFEKALNEISNKYGSKVQILTTESLPYKDYVNLYNDSHILMDQCYALDQGYNALEAMAKGKVVFTGAGKEFCKRYSLKMNEVAIHTIPETKKIVDDLSMLIENTGFIQDIGTKARKFVTEHHDYVEVAKKYVAAYQSIKTA